jgi:hypothetical protein
MRLNLETHPTVSGKKSTAVNARNAIFQGPRYFGWILGSPPGVPGGGITGVLPPPLGGTEMPGSIPAGGQITPFDWES